MIDELKRAMPLALSGAYDTLIYVPPLIALKDQIWHRVSAAMPP